LELFIFCHTKGEYIELGGRKVLYDPTDLVIEDRDNDVRYYNDFLADKSHFNYVSDDDSGITFPSTPHQRVPHFLFFF